MARIGSGLLVFLFVWMTCGTALAASKSGGSGKGHSSSKSSSGKKSSSGSKKDKVPDKD